MRMAPANSLGALIFILGLGSSVTAFSASPTTTHAFGQQLWFGAQRRKPSATLRKNAQQDVATERMTDYDSDCAKQFKVLTCSATSCSQKRKVLGLDEYATFSAFFERIENRIPEIAVEETSCLGSCKKAPCIAIEHEEYEGTVALEGMDSFEFSDRVFHRVIEASDADRVWDCVENAVRIMSEREREDDDDDDDDV